MASWSSARRLGSLLLSLDRLERADREETTGRITRSEGQGAALELHGVSVTLDEGSAVLSEADVEIAAGEKVLVVTDCTTTVVQSGSTLTQSSQCTTPPESPVKVGSFEQAGVGTVNPVTGEWTLDGSVFVPSFTEFFFSGEGVYAPDGQSLTGVSTAGFFTGQSLWLATTTGQRVS